MASDQSIAASEWSGTEEKTSEWIFTDENPHHYSIFRVHNNTDAEISYTFYMSDELDAAHERFEQQTFWSDPSTIGVPLIRTSVPSNEGTSITVASGGVDTRRVPQLWELVEFRITPTTSPSNGSINIIKI